MSNRSKNHKKTENVTYLRLNVPEKHKKEIIRCREQLKPTKSDDLSC